jgi:PTH2 family peptidyl-tRNA hydrolase
MEEDVKQAIVIRKDLKWKNEAGKLGVQMSHASNEFAMQAWFEMRAPSLDELEWQNGLKKKIALAVNSEEELMEIFNKAKEAGLEVHLVTDAGLTVFTEPTTTCLAIGPARASQLSPLTGHLKLFRL